MSWNRYLYALGDPINGIDPKGLQTCFYVNGELDSCEEEDQTSRTGNESGGNSGGGSDQQGHGGGGETGGNQPKVPQGNTYTQAQMQALNSGFGDALTRTFHIDCGDFLAGTDETESDNAAAAVESTLANTTYRLVPLPQGPGTGAQTIDSTDVMINSAGAFFNAGANANGTVNVSMPDSSGVTTSFTFGSLTAFRGFILLHELGHQMGAFGPDKDAAVNGSNSAGILDHCFTKNAQGVYN